MITKGQAELFRRSIIAQDDDNDYEESGWVCVRIADWCALTRYGHCSCYDTWASITGGGISDDEGPDDPHWDWQGTWAQLLEIAKGKMDTGLPGRMIEKEDYDYDHLLNVYRQILELENPKAASAAPADSPELPTPPAVDGGRCF